MRIAFVGKGGAGKSALAGTLCRILARRGHRVLALDADNVPGLAFSIGIPATDEWLLSHAAVREEGKGWQLVLPPEEAVERFGVRGPDGIRFLQFGKPTGTITREQQSSMGAFLQILRTFSSDGWTVVTDLAAGTRQSYTGWAGVVGQMLVVIEPSSKSLMTARRLARMHEMIPGVRLLGVANKVASEVHRRRIAHELDRIGIPLWAEVPSDPVFASAERVGTPPIDLDRTSPAVLRLEEIADRLGDEPGRQDRAAGPA